MSRSLENLPSWLVEGAKLLAAAIFIIGTIYGSEILSIKPLKQDVRDHDRRITSLETHILYIREGIDDIKKTLKR